MTEYSRMAKGTFTVQGTAMATGNAQIINLPFQPDYVEIHNQSAWTTPANHGVPFAWWDAGTPGTTFINVFNATPVLTTDTVTTGGISVFSGGLLLQFGAVYQHTGSTDFSISTANPAVVTTTTAHGLSSGQVVIFQDLYQTSGTGMPQIAGIPFTVTVLSSTTFSIPWNTSQSNYTAFNTATSTNNVGSFKQVLYPYLYFPGVSFITSITTGATTTISTTDAHNLVVGQEVAFRIPSAWGTIQLNSLPNTLIPGSPIYGYVVSVTNYNTVVVNINSTGYTAFNSNQAVNTVPGLSFPQMVAVGDVNTGGVQISSGSPLYPSPQYMPIGTTKFSTINGPAIQGAFVNNTSQGFIIGSGPGVTDTSAFLIGTTGNVIEWRAFLHDIARP